MTSTASTAGAERVTEYAQLINSGLRPVDVCERMGLSKGQGALAMQRAKARGLVVNTDHNWHREAQIAAAVAMRDRIAELAEQETPLPEIASLLGITANMVAKYWMQIRRGLGWQAV